MKLWDAKDECHRLQDRAEWQAHQISHQLDPGDSPRRFPGFPHQLWLLGLAFPQVLFPLANFLPQGAQAQCLDQSGQHLEKKGEMVYKCLHYAHTPREILPPSPWCHRLPNLHSPLSPGICKPNFSFLCNCSFIELFIVALFCKTLWCWSSLGSTGQNVPKYQSKIYSVTSE